MLSRQKRKVGNALAAPMVVAAQSPAEVKIRNRYKNKKIKKQKNKKTKKVS